MAATEGSSADLDSVSDLPGLAAELDRLRRRAARDTGRPKIGLDWIAKRCLIARSTAHTYLTGRSLPPADVLDRIVIALGASQAEQARWAQAWERIAAHADEAARTPSVPETAARPQQLPARRRSFVGREAELVSLDEATARPGPNAVVIGGPAGVGKTALVLQWAHRHRARYPDGQLWADLCGYDERPPPDPSHILAAFLRALGWPAATVPEDPEELIVAFRSHVSERRILVILDNASVADQVRMLRASGEGCLTLVTSRNRLAELALDDVGYVGLGLLSTDDARAMLRASPARSIERASERALDALAELCGNLPLALAIAVCLIELDPQVSLEQRIQQFTAHGRLLSLAIPDSEVSVRVAFDLSVAALRPELARTFAMLALLPDRDVHLAETAALTDLPTAELRGMLQILQLRHLIDQVDQDHWQLHDLVREYATTCLRPALQPAEVTAARHRLFTHHLAIVDQKASQRNPLQIRLAIPPAWRTEPPAGQQLEPIRLPHLVAVVESAAADGPWQAAWLLADALRVWLTDEPDGRLWARTCAASLLAAQRAGDRAGQVNSLLSMAALHYRQGRTDRALLLATQASELAASDTSMLGYAHAQVMLGRVLTRLGQPSAAVERYAAAAASAHPGIRQMAISGLGTLLYWLGRYDEATAPLREACELAGSTTNRVRSLNNLAHNELALGRVDLATSLADQGRKLAEDSGRSDALALIDNLSARILCAQARYPAAREAAERATRVAEEGSDLSLQTAAKNTCGAIELADGNLAKADLHYRQACELARHTGDQAMLAEALIGQAGAAAAAGRHGQALQYGRQARQLAASSELTAERLTAENLIRQACSNTASNPSGP